MAAKVIEVADAVKALIDAHGAAIGGPLSSPVTAERVYVTEASPSELEALRVTVVPAAVDLLGRSEGGSRSSQRHDYVVNVGVRKRVDAESLAEIDPLMEIVENILDVLRSNRIACPTLGSLSAVGLGNEPAYSEAMLVEKRVFLSVIQARYPAVRSQT